MVKIKRFRGKATAAPDRRPVLVPAFGKALKDARQGRDSGVIVNYLRDRQIKFSASQLTRYEQGRVLAPDPVVLHALAQFYPGDFVAWVRLLTWNRKPENLRQPNAPAPEQVEKNEVGMRVTGWEQQVVELFRALTNERRLDVVRMLTALAGVGTSAAQGGAAGPGSFRPPRDRTGRTGGGQ